MSEDFIGKNIIDVIKTLKEQKINYIVKDNNSGSGDFDTELVVRVKQINENTVELITSKFLVNI
ncbi:MAG: hypothetical protein PHC46_00825 [Clostridia bacterium]|nr:hypothetical protein [Clostridia bacterium]